MTRTARLLIILFLGCGLLFLSWYIPSQLMLWFLLLLLLLLIGMLLLYSGQKEQENASDGDMWQARLEASINSMYVGFMLIDANHNLITLNARAQVLFHVMPPLTSNFFYKNLPIISKDFTMRGLEEQLSEVLDLKGMIDECILKKKPVEKRDVAFGKKYLHLMLSPIVMFKTKPEVIGCVLLIEDATEASILARSRDEFFSVASHELRTPLTAIRGNVALIQQYFMDKIADDRFKQMLSDVHQSSVRLISIVDDFLDSSRLEQGRIVFKKESVDLLPLLQKLVKEYEPTVKTKKLSIKLEKFLAPAVVVGDHDRIKQVLINLLGNSLKHTEKGGIVISLEDTKSFLLLRVTDTGEGVSGQAQKNLFTKFQRLASDPFTNDTSNGSGLGLYISRLLTEGMGGKIVLEKTAEGKGSTFLVSLPKVR
ncbi:hypothetical protein BH11PAT1_BH11PAT1_0160 [soil metagenome]